MVKKRSVGSVLKSLFHFFVEVAFFWQLRLYAWWTRQSPKDLLYETLSEARNFEEWEAAAYQLDEVLGNELWRQDPTSRHYDYRLIYSRLQSIIEAQEEDDILSLVSLLRSGLVRNLGNITAPRLFNRAYAGTKLLIEDYITQVAHAVKHVTDYPTTLSQDYGLTNQAKLDLLHDTRQAFGRSVLVMQGGSIFGLCHIGVVKALHLRGLLPRIIAGTGTGALTAALVGVHNEEELLDFLSGDGIDLSAFSRRSREAASAGKDGHLSHDWFSTLLRRAKRWFREGSILDAKVLEECVKANGGELTFAEAYQRTRRVLNITVSPTGGGVPTLLNYLTAPNVLIWSAALASNAASTPNPISLHCKDPSGAITPWTSAPSPPTLPRPTAPYTSDRDSPLSRIAELFNVNHFIVSQARPYIAPFLRSDLASPKPRYAGRANLSTSLLKIVGLEMQHRLHQLDSLGYLPTGIRRLLLDENVPGASLTLVPEVGVRDYVRLLENPSKEAIEYWILKGERSVWPAVGALKVRCAVEVELDRGYQLVRRRKPFDASPLLGREKEVKAVEAKRKRKRTRAASMGDS
ncbi:triacylglycerol lipase [Zalaria obscura]|uniref:Triacylglycerol lipase n=1 Tax=Zalaria obscura TaxID=2024903 RepID=A0ACC3S6A3_9PEZI